MPTGPQRFRYPETLDEAKGTPFESAHRLFGARDTDALFKGAPKTTAPWPSAGRTKSDPRGYDENLVHAALKAPEQHMVEMDPRHLHSTQPWVTRAGVDYYSKSTQYRDTGETFANMEDPGNRQPVVYKDTMGRHKLLSGHHRASAALLNGSNFKGLLVQELSE